MTDYFFNLEAADGDAHASSFIVVPRWVEMCRATVPIIIAANGWDWQYEEGYSEEDNEWTDCRMEMVYFLLPWSDFPTPTRIPLMPDGSGPGAGGSTGGTANPGGPPVTLDSVRAPIAEATIAINGTLTLSSVRAFFSNTDDSLRNDVTWAPTDPTIASMDDNGIFTGMRSGTTTLIGTLATGGSATVMLTVSQRCDVRDDPPAAPGNASTPEAAAAFRAKMCLQPLGESNMDTLRVIRTRATNLWLRDFSTLSAEAREQCTLALAAVDSLLNPDLAEFRIFMGRDSTFHHDSLGNGRPHLANAPLGAQLMHFDPNYWRDKIGTPSGQRAIFISLLHEAVHAFIGSRSSDYGSHRDGDDPDYGNFAFFKYIEVPGPNSCLFPSS